jgi:hypothetical protein
MTFVQTTIDGRNLFDPAPPLGVLQVHHRFRLPVKVISDKGYLLVERFEGIA